MRIIFMGTPEFAVPSLDEIICEGHELLAVITQPDRPKGRGKKLTPSPVKEKALEQGIRIFQPPKLKDEGIISEIEKLSPDCIVVVAFGQILPKRVLNIPKFGCVNVHASLLPKYRGAAPINWAIINGERITGVTTMYMDEGLDTGDIILQKEVNIEDKTAGELHDDIAEVGAKLLRDTLKLVEKGTAPREKQKDSESSYAPMLNKRIGKINWNNSAEDIYNLIRGVIPWPTAFTTYKGEKFKIWKARVLGECGNDKPGMIVETGKEGISVCTADRLFLIEELQFPNSRRMTVDEYLRGNKIEKEVVLGERDAKSY
jgi:methionyl-tRNA formyltransferase